MNTVDALKDLYKTLCGKDYAGDPNPTDAEMISAIAKDASIGSGGGDGIPVLRVENNALVSHTWDELLELFSYNGDLLRCKGVRFSSDDPSYEYLNTFIWYVTDIDTEGMGDDGPIISKLYLGAGSAGKMPSSDREGSSTAVACLEDIEISKYEMAEDGYLRCYIPNYDSMQWYHVQLQE